MDHILRIGTDPAPWVLQDADYQATAQALSQSGPVIVPVIAPLQGRLVLSLSGPASVALLDPPGGIGWQPSDVALPRSPLLYLPTSTGPTASTPGYALAPGTDLAALEQEIVTTMTDGTLLTVQVSSGLGSGFVVLNGAVLPFAVLCQAVPVA